MLMSKTTRCLVIGSLIFGISAFAATATAQESEELSHDELEEDADNFDDVEAIFEEGARYYLEEDYSSAAIEFRRANQIHPHGIFQYNIALSDRALGRIEQGLEAALEADENRDDLDAETAASNSGLIAGFGGVLKADEVAEDVEDLREERRQVEAAPDAEPASRWGGLGWGGVAALGIGASALAGAAVLDAQVQSGIEELEAGESYEDGAEFREHRDSLSTRQTAGQVLLFSGAGLAVTGVSLMVVELLTGSPSESGVAASPSLTRPGLDIAVRW